MEPSDEAGPLLGDPQRLYGVDDVVDTSIPHPEKGVLVITKESGEKDMHRIKVFGRRDVRRVVVHLASVQNLHIYVIF